MEARQRWQALQAHLSAARQALNDGNQARASDEVNAALAIDPDFSAARALRERIDMPAPPALVATPEPIESIAVPEPIRTAATPRPLVSTEGFARFEERARRRRIERRADAARTAIVSGKRRDAKSAIDEIRGLDPNAPEIATLIAAVNASRRARGEQRRPWHVGPQLVAAAVFATIVLAASWVEQPQGLLSSPISIITALVATAQPAPLIATASGNELPAAGTSGAAAAEVSAITPTPSSTLRPPVSSNVTLTEIAPPVSTVPPPSPAATTTASTGVGASTPLTLAASLSAPSPVAVPPPAAPPPPVAASPPSSEPPVAEMRPADDVLVRRALLQYKSAYEALDARSAQAVWPVVNERALARAFDGLESQHLMFDACDVQVNGDGAAAICRGTARYVAKVGSREPRTEPRVWNFRLRKSGQDWKIESARAER